MAEARQSPSGVLQIAAASLILACSIEARAAEAGSFQDCDVCPRMQIVPAGAFTMGEPSTGDATRKGWGGPEIAMTIREPFAMSRTEITRAQFKAFLDDSGYVLEGSCRAFWPGADDAPTPKVWLDPAWPTGHAQADDQPMICINYHDAVAYAKWLTERTGGRRRYGLPSEAQFEYAARANLRGPWPWPSGEERDACGNANVADLAFRRINPAADTFSCDDGHAFTAPVASYPPNAFGLHDMLGNVWEWAEDCAADDKDLTVHARDGSPLLGPPADCTQRVTRGGGFVSSPWWTRVTARGGGHDPATRVSALGFRVVAKLDEY